MESSAKSRPKRRRNQGDNDKIVDNAPKKKRIRTKCSADGCNNIAQKGGICRMHGANKLEHTPKWGDQTCATDGCENKAYVVGGNCTKHGGKRLNAKCSIDGCNSYALKGGVCIKHGAKVDTKICSHE